MLRFFCLILVFVFSLKPEIKTSGYYVNDLSNSGDFMLEIEDFTFFDVSDIRISCEKADMMFANKKLHAIIDFDLISNAKDCKDSRRYFGKLGFKIDDYIKYFIIRYNYLGESLRTICMPNTLVKVVQNLPNYLVLYKFVRINDRLIAIENFKKVFEILKSKSIKLNQLVKDIIEFESMINPSGLKYLNDKEKFIEFLKQIGEITKDEEYNFNDIIFKLRQYNCHKQLKVPNGVKNHTIFDILDQSEQATIIDEEENCDYLVKMVNDIIKVLLNSIGISENDIAPGNNFIVGPERVVIWKSIVLKFKEDVVKVYIRSFDKERNKIDHYQFFYILKKSVIICYEDLINDEQYYIKVVIDGEESDYIDIHSQTEEAIKGKNKSFRT